MISIATSCLGWDGSPFYVGKGRRKRWDAHEWEAQKNKTYKDRVILKILATGHDVPKIKVREHLSHADAIATEIALIAAIGRHPDGPLVNMTDGGDGFHDPTGVVAAKISATLTGRKNGPRPPEVIEKIRQANLNSTKVRPLRSEASKALTGASIAAHWATEEGRALRSKAGMRGKKHSEATLERMSAAQTGRPMSEAAKSALLLANTGRKATPATRAKMARAHTERWRRVRSGGTGDLFEGG